MVKVRRYHTDKDETHNARNIEQLAARPSIRKQGGFCKTCNRWSVALNAQHQLCRHCEERDGVVNK